MGSEMCIRDRVWTAWMWPLDCAWNWQMCFSVIAAEGGRGFAAANDDTCAKAPRLLHFNCLRSLKDLLRRERLDFGSNTVNVTVHNSNAVRRALRSSHVARMCRVAGRRVPSVQARHCNVSFLFRATSRPLKDDAVRRRSTAATRASV